MKVLKKAQFKIFVLLTALLLLCASFLAGVPVARAFADDTLDESTVIYRDTDVEYISCWQGVNGVFFGFGLTESDYNIEKFETDYGGTEYYATYEKYVALWLTYWKNFSGMNSENALFNQLYAYWNGSSMPSDFANTVAHRVYNSKYSTSWTVEYGFMITIPQGTTFPSAEYVKGGCQGNVIMYRTTTAKTFYYNGTGFELLAQGIVEAREAVEDTIDSVDLSLYNTAEIKQIMEFAAEAKAQLSVSFTELSIMQVQTQFQEKVAQLMTKEDYKALANRKTKAIETDLPAIFSGLNEADYQATDWETILSIQNESVDVINSLASIQEVESALDGIAFAVNSVMTATEREAFAGYLVLAQASIQTAFNEALYRDAERAQGAAFVEEGKQVVMQATTYAAADAIKLEYIAKINGLKTNAQYEEEERRQQEEDFIPAPPSTDNGNSGNQTVTSSEEKGCGSSINAIHTIFAAVLIVAWMINKKKDGIEA